MNQHPTVSRPQGSAGHKGAEHGLSITVASCDRDSGVPQAHVGFMDDESLKLVELLKSQLEGIVALLDQHGAALPATGLTEAFDVLPIEGAG